MRSSVVYPFTAGFESSTRAPPSRHIPTITAGNDRSGVVPVPMVNESPSARNLSGIINCSSVRGLLRKDPVTDLDLIIIGGGPAGLTAGLYAARANMTTGLLDSQDTGGEILYTELIEEYHGRGVSYCAVCDGAFFKGADLAIIGGGDSAFQEGLFLTRFANKLYVVHRRNEFRAQAILQDRLLKMDKVEPITPAEVKEIGGNGVVKWIDIDRDGKRERVKVEGVFVFIGFKPVGRHLFKEHIDHDKNGYLITDQYMRTSIPGVYAAGDTRAQLAKQITTAVGDATTAVLHAERYIEELKDIERVFPGEPKDVAAETARKADILEFAPGEIVLREGELADRVYMVIKGEAEATRTGPNGAQVAVGRFGPGDYFGEVGLLNNGPRIASVRAVTSLEVMALDQAAFSRLMESSQATRTEVKRVAGERERFERR